MPNVWDYTLGLDHAPGGGWPLAQARTGDPVLDARTVAAPPCWPRLQKQAIEELARLSDQFPLVSGLQLKLWGWRLFPFSADKDLSLDPLLFLSIEPMETVASLYARNPGIILPAAFKNGAQEPWEKSLRLRSVSGNAALGWSSRDREGRSVSHAEFVDCARLLLPTWSNPVAARSLLLASGSPHSIRLQGLSGPGRDVGQFQFSRPDWTQKARETLREGAALIESEELARVAGGERHATGETPAPSATPARRL